MPDDGMRRELLEGVPYVVPSPNVDHQRVVARIVERLRVWIREHQLGELFVAPLDVVVAKDVSVQPDALFVRADRVSSIVRTVVEGPPDLVIEVLSESNFRHDLLVKRRLYARFRIPEYWLVDPQEQTVSVLELVEDAYRDTEPVSGDQPIPSRVLPGLPVQAGELFRD
jgi:Uma2 family endonuclease